MNWTDDRLDHLSQRMDERFDYADERFRQVDERFDRLEGEIRGMRSELNLRFDGMQRVFIQFGVTMIAALLGVLATQL